MRTLVRRLGLPDAVVLGLGAMLGAGVFVAFGPATAAAGAAVPLSLMLAGAIAWANADSSARLARLLPTSGGAYAYGRARLNPFWGGVAGYAFLIGKTASVAAITTTVGTYLWPERARAVGLAAVVVLTVLAASGARRGARASAAVVGVVLAVLAAVAVLALAGTDRWAGDVPNLSELSGVGPLAVLQGAGLLFFAFAGYARIATLGEEVRDPERTLPRAILVALGIVLAVYAGVGAVLFGVLGVDGLAASRRPVAEVASVLADGPAWPAVVVVAAVLAAAASGLGVLLGLSRTVLAMARDGLLPGVLARLHGPDDEPRPLPAQVAVGCVAGVAAIVVDLPRAIAISSAAVLVYYAVAHAAALTLPGRRRRVVPVLGLLGCLTVAATVAT